MTKIISFANQKGGVGKSTLCLQMTFLLVEQGKKVLVIDFDPQGNTSSRLAPNIVNEEEWVTQPGTKTVELFTEGFNDIHPLKCPMGADLIFSTVNDPELAELESIALEEALNPAANLQEVVKNYDYVLIDCPPSLGRKLVAALTLSTHVVCPVQLSGFAVDGVEGLLKTVISIQRSYNEKLEIVGLAINNMDRSVSHERALEQLNEIVPDLLLKNIVMHRSPLDRATSDGVPVWSLNYGHVAAKEVKALLNEILERVELS